MSTKECSECQSLFSDFAERALGPARHEAVTVHLASCEVCKADFLAFQAAVRSLRAVPREDAPPGLRDAIVASLPPIPMVAAAVAPTPRSRRFVGWLAAAAVLLLGFGVTLLYQREAWWHAQIAETLDRQRESHDSTAAGQRRDLEQRIARLEQSLETESGARTSAEESSRAQGAMRQELAASLARLELESRSRGERLERLEKDLALASAERKSLEVRARAAEEALESARRAAPVEPVALAAEPEPLAGSLEPRRRTCTTLREVDGRLELSVRGSREQVIPELFALARSGTNPDASDLALNALENLLHAPSSEPSAPARPEGWLKSRLADVAGVIGMAAPVADSAEAPPSLEARRSARLAALERAWDEEQHTAQE